MPHLRFWRARALREDVGQSIVELSLMLPLLVFGLIGGADLARAFAIQLAVQNGARAGAESYAIDSTPTTDEAKAAAMAPSSGQGRSCGMVRGWSPPKTAYPPTSF